MATTLSVEPTQQLFESWYDRFIEEWSSEPTVITIHRIHHHFGGPEEGGWWYEAGEPIQNVCIFSKDQTVKELIKLHNYYQADEEADYNIDLSNTWGDYYPKERPHYC